EEIWSSAGRPLGLTKLDCTMPRWRALAFISSAKFSIEPATPSASTTAMSLADFTINILSALSTVTTVPTPNPIFTGDCAAAFEETTSGVSRPRRPPLTARKVTKAVLRFVTEAGDQGYPAFWAKRTLPLSASITSNASAPARLGASALAAQAMPTHMSVRARQDRVEDITARDSMLLKALGKRAIGEKV